jgi:predicted AAA+ superfamily ATPase
VLSDSKQHNTRFVILGSASPSLIKGASESLAGRIHFIDMAGFSLKEVGKEGLEKLWMRGGFPRSYLAASESKSILWRTNFIRTFLERDIPQLGINIPTERIRKFWYMLAHYHGNILNASEIGKSLNLTSHTIQYYLEILSGTYMIELQQPWHESISKRQVKSPKLFIRDTGL